MFSIKRKPGTDGFTLIEIIIFIMIVSISFGILGATFLSILPKSYESEYISTATSLCEKKMEEVMAKSFAEITDTNQRTGFFSSPFSKYKYKLIWSYLDNDFSVSLNSTDRKKIDISVSHEDLSSISVSASTLFIDCNDYYYLKFNP